MTVSLNDTVLVKLTPKGRELHRKNYDDLNRYAGGKILYPYRPVKETKAGWSRWQLWVLMHEFGPFMTMGADVPFENTIRIL